MDYNKPPLTFSQQVDLLQQRGLMIQDPDRCADYLKQISYYRLSAYALVFQQQKDQFNRGTTFQNILDLYVFDRELRLLVFDAIERIEVGIKTQLIYQLSHKYGAHWYTNAQLFKKTSRVDVCEELKSLVVHAKHQKNPETFIKHYFDRYQQPDLPPAWMTIELLTFGQISRLFKHLKDNDDKRLIADQFGVHHTVFASWLHSLTYIRNICGHHGRLWNREIAIEPIWLKKTKKRWINPAFQSKTNRTFYSLCIIQFLLNTINPSSRFKEKLNALMNANKCPKGYIKLMGIPTDQQGRLHPWLKDPLWAGE